MKIVITAMSPNLDSAIDPRFGRADYFVIVEENTLEWNAFPQPGCGAQAGLARKRRNSLPIMAYRRYQRRLRTECLQRLECGGVEMYLFGHAQTVREAIEHFKDSNSPGSTHRLRLNIATIRKDHENHSCERQGRHGQDYHCNQPSDKLGGRWAYSCLSGWRCGSAQRPSVSQTRF
jgi:predicted Fe-Mo cluster-binding NifX family protein